MNGKTSKETAVTLSQRVLPQDANPAGNVHGGVILKYIDTAAGTVAMRHSRTNTVTASIDRMDFLAPVFVGELVTFKACINYVGTTSMEVGVRVEAENLRTGEVRYTNSAYLTFVALDDDGRPTPIAPLILETEVEERRWREAKERRKARMAEKARERCSQGSGTDCPSK